MGVINSVSYFELIKRFSAWLTKPRWKNWCYYGTDHPALTVLGRHSVFQRMVLQGEPSW